MALAVYLTWPNLEGKVPIPPLPTDLDPRWTPETVNAFRNALRAFAAHTCFIEFFYAGHRDYHDRSLKSLLSSLEGHPIIPWLKSYFGQESEHYVILVGMQIGSGNYGMSTTLEDGSREFISVIGASSPSLFRETPRFSNWWFVPTVIHEFAHSFVNPLVDSNEYILRDVAERLYPYHRDKLAPQGCASALSLPGSPRRFVTDHSVPGRSPGPRAAPNLTLGWTRFGGSFKAQIYETGPGLVSGRHLTSVHARIIIREQGRNHGPAGLLHQLPMALRAARAIFPCATGRGTSSSSPTATHLQSESSSLMPPGLSTT